MARQARGALGVVMAAAAVATGLRASGAFRFEVHGESMRPTLLPGDWLVAVPRRRICRGDIVVLAHPHRGLEVVKRVIGVPGERVETDGTSVWVNGRALSEPYASGRGAPGAWELGPDSVVVLGDNRTVSADSRAFGTVAVDAIGGRAVLRYWPRPRLLRRPRFTGR